MTHKGWGTVFWEITGFCPVGFWVDGFLACVILGLEPKKSILVQNFMKSQHVWPHSKQNCGICQTFGLHEFQKTCARATTSKTIKFGIKNCTVNQFLAFFHVFIYVGQRN